MANLGIDISRWQGNFNLAQAQQEGVKFVIIKAAGGDAGLYTDSQFVNNYNKAKALGMPCGCYFYSKAMNVDEARKEAEYFYNVIKDKQFELPVYFDIEEKSQRALGKRALTDIIKTQCNFMEEHGYYVGIYSSASFFQTDMYDDELKRYDHWIAAWSSNKPTGWTPEVFGIWQFGGSTNKLRSTQICGQTVDQDYIYKDYSVIKNNGLNGFGKKKEEPKVEEPQISTDGDAVDLAIRVCMGEFGNGEDRVKKLGNRYKEVQDIVNAYFKMKEALEG